MKKMIALLLALLMVSSAVIAVSAEGTGEVVPTAPTIFAQTEPVKEGDEVVAYNVRFLAAVHETTGDAIGFEVVAKFSDKEVEYSNAKGDTAMEGTTLYKNVMVNGKSEPVTGYDADAIGMFAAGINGVPAKLDVVFEIKAYISYGESEKVETDVVTAQYANGKILSMTGADVYTQDFNATNSVTAAANAGVKNLYSGKMNPTISNGMLRIPSSTWANGAFVSVIDNSVFKNNINDLDEVYMIEMDLDITVINNICFIFNGSVNESESATNTRATRKGAGIVQFKIDGDAKGSISNMGEKSFYARTGYMDGSTQQIASSYGPAIYTMPKFGNDPKSAVFKLGLVIDNTPTNGCDIHIFVDGVYKNTRQLSETTDLKGEVEGEYFDVTENSYVSLWAENSAFSIDNLKVSKITNFASQTYPTTNAVAVYSQNFENDPVTSAGVTRLYANDKCPSGLPIIINDAGQLQIDKHAWHNAADYFANVVPATGVNGADLYKFEAYVSITSASNFGFTLNNKHNAQKTDAYQYLSNFLFVKFIKDGDNLKSLHITEADAAGGTGNTVTKTEYALTSTVSAKDGFKFSVIVDSTDANACVLYLFINDELVAVHTTAGNDWDVADVSTIGVFAQDTVATIDNIKVTGVKKTAESDLV